MTRGINGERYPTDEDAFFTRSELGSAVLVMFMLIIAAHLGVQVGEANMAGLASSAFHREQVKTELLRTVIEQNERSLAYIATVDAELHEQIARMYPAHPYVIAWQEAEDR